MQEAVQIASALQAERDSVEALRQEAMQSVQQRQHDMDLQLEAANSRVNRSVLWPPPLLPAPSITLKAVSCFALSNVVITH